MGTFTSGLFGDISGTVGDMVYKKYNGKTYVSRRPRKTTNKPTAAQQVTRARFALVIGFLKGIAADLNLILSNTGSKSLYNKLVSDVYHSALGGEFPDLTIDYAKVHITSGNLGPLYRLRLSDEGEGTFQLNWDMWESRSENWNDTVSMFIYCQAYGWRSVIACALRQEKTVSVQIPLSYRDQPCHLYVCCVSKDRRACACSSYFSLAGKS